MSNGQRGKGLPHPARRVQHTQALTGNDGRQQHLSRRIRLTHEVLIVHTAHPLRFILCRACCLPVAAIATVRRPVGYLLRPFPQHGLHLFEGIGGGVIHHHPRRWRS